MKSALLVLLLLSALPSFALDSFLSRRVVSTTARSEALPRDLHFAADQIRVSNPSWFTSLFGPHGCESDLSQAPLDTTIEILTGGPGKMDLYLNGHPSTLISEGSASYIPVYYHHGVPVHPHFMVKTKQWVLIHISIHKSGAAKSLRLSVVQGQGDDVHLVPVLEADGI